MKPPSSFEAWAWQREEVLETMFGQFRTRVSVAWTPPLSVSSKPQPEERTIEVHQYDFLLTFMTVYDHENDRERKFIRITDHKGNVMEIRPITNFELTRFHNRA